MNHHLTKKIFILLSLIICTSGAINSGYTKFFMATPFAIYLILKFKNDLYKLIYILIFIVFCVVTSVTQDSNHLLYPILGQKIHITNKCGFKIESANEYDQFISFGDSCENNNNFTLGEKIILESGNYTVIKIEHSYQDMGDFSYPVINYKNKNLVLKDYHYNTQATWAKYLGLLVYWPFAPIIIIYSISSIKF